MIRKQLLSLMGVISFSIAFGQVQFRTNGFKTAVNSVKDLPICTTTDLGFYIPINATLSKYDQVSFVLQMREKGSQEAWRELSGYSFNSLYNYPTSKVFKDQYAGKKYMDVYVMCPTDVNRNSLIEKADYCEKLSDAEYISSYEYKVAVKAYFKTGTETYWSDYHEAVKTRDVYEFSKELYVSDVITFAITAESKKIMEEKAAALEAENERLKRLVDIKEKYTIEMEVPYVGTTQPRLEIYNAYLILREELLVNEDFETLQQVDEKLLSISRKFKLLKKALNGETDTAKIKSEILNFPY